MQGLRPPGEPAKTVLDPLLGENKEKNHKKTQKSVIDHWGQIALRALGKKG